MGDELCTAVANGDIEVNHTQSKIFNNVMISCRVCLLIKLVAKLLSEGVKSNQASREGYFPLCIAAFWDHVDITKLLLQHK